MQFALTLLGHSIISRSARWLFRQTQLQFIPGDFPFVMERVWYTILLLDEADVLVNDGSIIRDAALEYG